jgi:acetyl-CoA acetyltransferase
VEAALRCAADAGVGLGEVDALFVSKSGELTPGDLPADAVARALGIRPRYTDTTLAGGAAPVIQVARAAAAVTEGRCRLALVSYASTQASRRLRSPAGWPGEPDSPVTAFERPTGYRNVASVHALIAHRHMHEHGTTAEQLAAVAVAARAWARLNPAACRREPLTVEDVLASRIVSEPLHALDCCLVTDGGGAVLVGPRGAGRRGRAPLRVHGFAERHSHLTVAEAPSLTTSAAAESGPEALAMAAAEPADIDVLQLYDAFTDMPILLLEDLGFCAKGEGGPLVESGATAPGGRLPANTQGGGLSHCHPGMYGIFLVVEAARQLWGEAGARQVGNARRALCHGVGGGAFGIHATLVLGRD